MKHPWRLALLSVMLLVAVTFGLSSCGEKPTPPEPPVSEYTITFSVNGESFEQTVRGGETPEFSGSTDKPADLQYVYTFAGWDKPIVPANADATYTAQYTTTPSVVYTITWILYGDNVVETKHVENTIPTPPETARGESEGYYHIFKEWDMELLPVTEDTFYRARYTKEPKLFPVTFSVRGETVAVVDTPYDSVPVYPADAPLPKWGDCQFAGWTVNSPIKGAVTSEAIFTLFDPAATQRAVDTLGRSKVGGTAASSALYLALQEHECPGILTDYVVDYLKDAYDNARLQFDLIPNFFYPSVAALYAVAKDTPGVWGKLSAAEIEEIDWIMRSFAVIAAIGTDDENTYSSGPGYTGNYGKGWNPNYRLSNVTPLLFCVDYFGGADAVNRILADFDYDTYVAKFKEYGWTYALDCWTHDALEKKVSDPDGDGLGTYETITDKEDNIADPKLVVGTPRTVNYVTPRRMLMNGGEVFCIVSLGRIGQWVGMSGGTGIGVPAIGQKGYSYMGHSLSEIADIWDDLLAYNYSGGRVTSSKGDGEWRAYIEGELTSPYQGIPGMMKEFNSGARSSASYCKEDFTLVMTSHAALELLGYYDSTAKEHETIFQRMWIGNNDLIYKLEKGYWSFSGTASRGKPYLCVEDNGNGYMLWKSYWYEKYDSRYTLAFFEDLRYATFVLDGHAFISSPTTENSPDITLTGGYAGLLKAGKEYWENSGFIFEFTVRNGQFNKEFGIRLRTGAKRNDLIVFTKDGKIASANASLVTPVGDYPDTVALQGYGWHRIAILYEQKSTADPVAKTVSDTFTLTVLINGEVKTVYQVSEGYMKSNGWNLYTATYDETQPGNIKYTANTSSEPYWQIYSAGVYNNPQGRWCIEIGDLKTSSGTTPAVKTARVVYHLQGGEVAEPDLIQSEKGYQTEYRQSPLAYFVTERAYALPELVREGYRFVGWYDNPEGTGNKIETIKADGSEVIELYAVFEPDTQTNE